MKLVRFFFAILVVALVAVNPAFSRGDDNELDRIRERVEQADANDWQVLSEAAKECIELKINISEAYVWLERSINIEKNADNMEVKGDYFMINGVKEMAAQAYSEALILGMNQEGYDLSRIQQKMLDLR